MKLRRQRNRTDVGAKAQSILMSVMMTAGKRGIEAIDWLAGVLKNQANPPPLSPNPQTG